MRLQCCPVPAKCERGTKHGMPLLRRDMCAPVWVTAKRAGRKNANHNKDRWAARQPADTRFDRLERALQDLAHKVEDNLRGLMMMMRGKQDYRRAAEGKFGRS